MAGTELVCEQTIKRHGNAFTLGPLSLTIGKGVTCLVGANGAGKSTFFHLAARVDRPSSGSIGLSGNGRRTSAAVGFLPQDPLLPRAATCEQFLHYVAWVHRVPPGRREKVVAEALAITGLTKKRAAKIRALSGGMVRRLGIAHTLLHDPALMLLDEPTVGLDPKQRIALRETISKVAQDRIVVVATHLIEDVRAIAKRVVLLDRGQVLFDGDIPSLEQRADSEAPGESDLERAVASLIGGAE